MEGPVKKGSLTYSLADQSFARTKSVGILNVSVDLLHVLARHPLRSRLVVMANDSLRDKLKLPAAAQIRVHNGAAEGRVGRIWWDQFGVYAAARRTGNEWLFLPKGFASFARRCPVRLAVYVHDVMQDHYDCNYPDATCGLEAAYFRASFRAAVHQAEILFTPSEFTRSEIERVARARNWRLPHLICVGEGFDRPELFPVAERRDVVVLAGRFPHKLTRRAVEYLTRWRESHPFEGNVHWVGSFPDGLEMPARPNWMKHSRLAETEFRSLIGKSRVVVFFSDYEGFGRPPVEAVLAGSCPVYSDIPATREVMCGCGCAFDNSSHESFTAALQRALATTPEQLRVWGDELLSRHNWNAVADRILPALCH
jgi:glycosyltransferase involved in cell wall biosynthesis